MSDEKSHSDSNFYYPKELEEKQVTTNRDENFGEESRGITKVCSRTEKWKRCKKKTSSDMKCFYRFLGEINKSVQILNLPPEEHDHLLGKFFQDVRKINGEEYEPSTLTELQITSPPASSSGE